MTGTRQLKAIHFQGSISHRIFVAEKLVYSEN